MKHTPDGTYTATGTEDGLRHDQIGESTTISLTGGYTREVLHRSFLRLKVGAEVSAGINYRPELQGPYGQLLAVTRGELAAAGIVDLNFRFVDKQKVKVSASVILGGAVAIKTPAFATQPEAGSTDWLTAGGLVAGAGLTVQH